MKGSLLSAIMIAVASYMDMERADHSVMPQNPKGRSSASRRRQLQELAWHQSMPLRFRRDRLGRNTLYNSIERGSR